MSKASAQRLSRRVLDNGFEHPVTRGNSGDFFSDRGFDENIFNRGRACAGRLRNRHRLVLLRDGETQR
jgi:hypothetical protein